MCGAPRRSNRRESRTGIGGGYNERDNVEYRRKRDSDGEYDDFGRKRRKRDADKRGGDKRDDTKRNDEKSVFKR